MSVLKCEMCGGTMVLEDGGTVAVCEYCGTRKAMVTKTATVQSTTTPQINNNSNADAVRIENEKRKAEEAKARAEEARLKAESQRLERERIAQQKRAEKSKNKKDIGKKILTGFLSFVAVVAVSLLTITVIIPSVKYSGAVKDIEKGNYEEAYLTFKSISRFKDSSEQADKLIRKYPQVAQVGDIIYLGKYEQDNKTANGKEEIEWKVLDKDDNGKMLLVSRYALDCKKYHNSPEKISWEASDIRAWLNNDFYSSAFNKNERATIKAVTLSNDNNSQFNTDGGNETKDKVFLLSESEAKTYLPKTIDRVCIATKYAENQGSQLENITRSCRWWLRTPGSTLYSVSFVKVDGFILQIGVGASLEKRSVRPAIWVQF